MEKQSSTPYNNNNNNNNSNYNVPNLGPGTSTTSGVTVFDPSMENTNNQPPPPPTYDQAIGNSNTTTTTTTTTRNVNYSTGWSAPGNGASNTGYNMPPTTNYTYATSMPAPPQHQQTRYAQQPTTTQPPIVIIQQQPMLPLGPEPVYLTCPACHIQKLTRIEYEPSSRTHLMAALLCLVGLWCCVCLPYCAGSCMNTHHYCGNCGKFLGTYGNTL